MASKIGWFDEPEEAAEDWNRRAALTISPEEFDPHKTPVGARLDAGLWD